MKTMMLIALLIFKMVFPEEAMSLQEKLFIANYYYNTEWKYTMYDNGIGVGERWLVINDSLGVRERRGEIMIACNYNRVIQFLSDYRTFNLWMKNVKSVTPQTDADQSIHLVFGMPWPMSNRDAVVTLKAFPLDSNSCIIQLSSSEKSPHVPKHVRISHYQTAIRVTRLDDNRTNVQVSTFTDEPPMLPVRLQDPFIRKSLYNNLLELKSILTFSQTAQSI